MLERNPTGKRSPLLLLLTPERRGTYSGDTVERTVQFVTLGEHAKPLGIDERPFENPIAGYAELTLALRCSTIGRQADPFHFDLRYRFDAPHPEAEAMRAKVKTWDALQRRLQKDSHDLGPIRCASDLLARVMRAAGVRTLLQYLDEDNVRGSYAHNDYRRHDPQGARWLIERIEHDWLARYPATDHYPPPNDRTPLAVSDSTGIP